MYNSSDLEGDVDHSFFDSDHDDDRDRGRRGRSEDNGAEESVPSGSFDALEDGDSDCSTEGTRRAPVGSRSASEVTSERSSRARTLPSSYNLSSRYSSPGASRSGRAPSAGVPSRASNRSSRAEGSDCTQRGSPASSPFRDSSAKGKRRESVTPTRASSILRPEGTLNADTDSFASGSLIEDNLILHCRGRPCRKNFTFNNIEVQRIDHENQRLLRVLSRISLAPGAIVNQFTRKNTSPHIPHSSANRLREQKRIEKDNQALLKRLEYVKPTPALKRANLLSDYQRQVRFQATPCEVCDAATNILPSSVAAGLASIRGSTSQIGTRVTSASSNTARSKALLAARPPFCC
ncbi:cilia- and flagella-associated protein 97 [Syngnathus acus]|uniref:cilia- and flagella-associated protein 97 n=1 Tax=Syngnathus acus TaxID=161584 RepID=UPI001885AC80|nr:cilia- and flagella-associated protein 97 [Syngnathus acus]